MTEQALAELPTSALPIRDALRTAWNELASVQTIDGPTIANVLLVLIETVAGDLTARLPPPPRLPRPRIHRGATAAHPRAYKGTKQQPPKPPVAAAIDLRPHLDDTRLLQGLARDHPAAWAAEDDHLVCFGLYPLAAGSLATVFDGFDRTLAAAIGLPLWKGRDREYEIASILSRDWWDDGAWFASGAEEPSTGSGRRVE